MIVPCTYRLSLTTPLSIEVMVMQVIILGLAVYRHLTITARLKSVLITLIFRDGLLLFLIVFGLFQQ